MKHLWRLLGTMALLWLSLDVAAKIIDLWASGGFWRIVAWAAVVSGIAIWVFGVVLAVRIARVNHGEKREIPKSEGQ